MLRLIKFAKVIEPGKLFTLQPVMAEKPQKGEPPWQLQNTLSLGQVRKDSAPQFHALIHFVEGKGVWKLSDSDDDREIRVDRNRAVVEWLLLLGRNGWYETSEKLLAKDLPSGIVQIFQSDGEMTETFEGGEVRNLTSSDREGCGMLHLFLAWFEGAFAGAAPTAGGCVFPGLPLRPGDRTSMVTKKKLVDLGGRGAVPVAPVRADPKATVVAKVLKSIWTDAKGDTHRWTGVLQVSFEECDVVALGRCSSDSDEDSANTSYNFNEGGGKVQARPARPRRGAQGPRGPQTRSSAGSS